MSTKLMKQKINQTFIKAPAAWSQDDPPLVFDAGTDFFGMSELHPKSLLNTIAIGGTGSGKTESLVKPLLSSMLQYRIVGSKPPAMLILDPKAEFQDLVRAKLDAVGEGHRLFVVGEGPPLSLFEPDMDLSIEDRVNSVFEFCDSADQRFGGNDIWFRKAKSLIHQFSELQEASEGALKGNFIKKLGLHLNIPQPTSGDTFWHWLRAILAFSSSENAKFDATFAGIKDFSFMIGHEPPPMMSAFKATKELIEQWSYVIMSTEPILGPLCEKGMGAVDLDLYPDPSKQRVSIMDLVDSGAVLLFTPGPTSGHRAAAKALKARFYQTVFSRNDMRQPIFIVLDEAHTFVSEREASLLDRCRAYRCCAVLATQSLSSLEHALGSGSSAERAVEILVANSPSRFTFRSTDDFTGRWLKTQIPPPSMPYGPHVLDVRPLSGLKPGEAYWSLADSRWGRSRANIENFCE